MRRPLVPHRRSRFLAWALLALAAVLALAACGGSASAPGSPSSRPSLAGGLTANEIVAASQAKMATVTSATFAADLGLAVKGDPAKIADPTLRVLLADGLTLHAEGQSATRPTAADTTISLGFAGQTLDFELLAKGRRAWIQYEETWYALAPKTARAVAAQAGAGATPAQQLHSFGLDPAGWDTSFRFAGIDSLNGVRVYHVTADLDAARLAEALTRAGADPRLARLLGGVKGPFEDLVGGLPSGPQASGGLEKNIGDARVDYWIGVADRLLYKATLAARVDASGQGDPGSKDSLALTSTIAMSNFDQRVFVTAPAKAQPSSALVDQLFGGVLGGVGLGY